MLDTDVDSFFNVPITNPLVDYDANGGLCDVVNDPSFAVVDFVGHAA